MIEITIEQCIESFPYSSFLKQEGKPIYKKIKTIYKLAAANAASIEITKGEIHHRYLAIVLDDNT